MERETWRWRAGEPLFNVSCPGQVSGHLFLSQDGFTATSEAGRYGREWAPIFLYEGGKMSKGSQTAFPFVLLVSQMRQSKWAWHREATEKSVGRELGQPPAVCYFCGHSRKNTSYGFRIAHSPKSSKHCNLCKPVIFLFY